LGSLLALGMNPEAQVSNIVFLCFFLGFASFILNPPQFFLGSTKGKGSFTSSKKTGRWIAEAFDFGLYKRFDALFGSLYYEDGAKIPCF